MRWVARKAKGLAGEPVVLPLTATVAALCMLLSWHGTAWGETGEAGPTQVTCLQRFSDGDLTGASIDYLGDLDGDGTGDLIVGAPYESLLTPEHGAVWIVFLYSSGAVKNTRLITNGLNGFSGFLWAYDHFGSSVASLGDLDGDGNGDVAVGANGTSLGGVSQGGVWILFLNSNGTVKSDSLITEATSGFGGVLDPNDEFGSVTALGDVDGDMIMDIGVGARGDDDGGADRGAMWILFLNTNGTVKGEQKVSNTAGGFAGTLDNGDLFGATAAGIGDLDGDGVRDVAVGAMLDDDGGLNKGAVWVLFLNANGTVKAHQKISQTTGGFTDVIKLGDRFSVGLASLPDLDFDGNDELAIASDDDDGGPNRGAFWIVYLSNNGTVHQQKKLSDLEGGFTGILDDGDSFGRAICSIGDHDGDGRQDLAVGAPADDDGGPDRGAVWLLYLDPAENVILHNKISDAVLTLRTCGPRWMGCLTGNTLDFNTLWGPGNQRFFTITSNVRAILNVDLNLSCPDYTFILGGASQFMSFTLQANESRRLSIFFEPLTGGNHPCIMTTGTSCPTLNVIGYKHPTAVGDIPLASGLHQNHPNPFNPSTEIQFDVDQTAEVRLTIYDTAGRRVRTLVAAVLPPGTYAERWNGRDDHGGELPSGIYLYRLEVGNQSWSRKAVMLK